WSSGKVSTEFVNALSERAEAGVKVHVIVDWLGSWRLKRKDANRMRDAGVNLVRMNPLLSLKFFRFNHRTHRKLWIVDVIVGFLLMVKWDLSVAFVFPMFGAAMPSGGNGATFIFAWKARWLPKCREPSAEIGWPRARRCCTAAITFLS